MATVIVVRMGLSFLSTGETSVTPLAGFACVGDADGSQLDELAYTEGSDMVQAAVEQKITVGIRERFRDVESKSVTVVNPLTEKGSTGTGVDWDLEKSPPFKQWSYDVACLEMKIRPVSYAVKIDDRFDPPFSSSQRRVQVIPEILNSSKRNPKKFALLAVWEATATTHDDMAGGGRASVL